MQFFREFRVLIELWLTEIRSTAENATIGQRLVLGLFGLFSLFTGLVVGWSGFEAFIYSRFFREIGFVWIGLGTIFSIIGCVEIWIALYPIPHRARHWIRRMMGVGLLAFAVFVTAPYASDESCRSEMGSWLCTASACLTALAILVGTLLVTGMSKHRHRH